MTLTLSEFFDRYGTDTTNSIQLYHIAKQLKIPNFYYAMRDEVSSLPKDKKPLNVMTNIHTSEQPGVHHNCFHISDKGNFFFDSYGLNPTREVVEFMGRGVGSSFKIQQDDTRYCGQMSMYVLYRLNLTNDKFENIILDLKKNIEHI